MGEVDGGALDDDSGAVDIGYKLRYIDISTAASDYRLDHSFRIGF